MRCQRAATFPDTVCSVMSTKRTCGLSWKVMLWLLLALLATGYPATSSPDTPASPGGVALERACASFRELSFPDGARAAPLTQGPCAEGEWAVLDLAATEGPRLRCALRPCPQGRVPWEGRCLSYAEASSALCGGDAVEVDSTGLPCCSAFRGTPSPPPTPPPPTTTEVTSPRPTVVAVGSVHCAQGDGGGCAKEVRGPPSSNLELEAED